MPHECNFFSKVKGKIYIKKQQRHKHRFKIKTKEQLNLLPKPGKEINVPRAVNISYPGQGDKCPQSG